MKTRKFENPNSGKIVETSDRAEVKKYKACGWREIKSAKQSFAKGLTNGNTFFTK